MVASGPVDLSGQVIRGYVLEECIGAGGFGAVYRATQSSIDREVAVKIILPEYANHPDFIRRFEREARLVARLEHPHIIPMYDFWREPNGAYLVMRWLRGGSLRDRVNAGPMDAYQVADYLDQIASALTVSHRAGVVHRDLKPDNVLLDEMDNTYLADFGIAKDISLNDEGKQSATLVGSPAYLSPEQVRSESVSPQTDVYSMGIVLYEMLTGSKPFPNVSAATLLYKHLRDPIPDLEELRPDLPEDLNMVIQRATLKDPEARYTSMLNLAAEFRLSLPRAPQQVPGATGAASSETEMTVTLDVDLPEIANPYKGLRAFQEADAGDFYGRETLVATLLGRMREPGPEARFLAVVGPSGSGKSSVVKAGLIPALRGGALDGSENWFIVEMVPDDNPQQELEAAVLSIAIDPSDSAIKRLYSDSTGLLYALKRMMPDDGSELVLVIDQFEELFTQVKDENIREQFIDSLLTALRMPESRLRVIITLRADFYDRPLLYEHLGELVRQRTEVVLPLNTGELERAIAIPAETAGLQLEKGLVSRIVADVAEQPGALPLLQYALTELFEKRDGYTLTLESYEQTGGVLGALARRAEDIYVDLDAPSQEATRQLFLRLVTPGEGTEDTRRRVFQSQLLSIITDQAALNRVLNVYGQRRLLTFDHDPITRAPTIEVAHEALIRTWDRLRGWIDDSREDLRIQRRLVATVHEWVEVKRDDSYLATGARLVQLQEWSQTTNLALGEDEQAYIQKSIQAHEARLAAEAARQAYEEELEARALNRLRILAVVLLVGVVVSLILMAFALNERQLAVSSAATATFAQGDAENQARIAAAAAAEALSLLWTSQAQQALDSDDTSLALRLALSAIDVDAPPLLTQRLLYSAAYRPGAQRRFTGHQGSVTVVVFSPDGRWALSGGTDNTLRWWDLETGETIHVMRGHTLPVRDVAISPDGQTAVSASDDGTLMLWDLETGELLRTFVGHGGFGANQEVIAVDFHPNGEQILSGSTDRNIILWDVESGEIVRRFEGHSLQVYDVDFGPEGATALSTSEDRTINLWDVESGEILLTLRPNVGEARTIRFGADGETALSGMFNGALMLWDLETGDLIQTFTGHTGVIESVAFSPDGQTALSASDDQTLILWDVESGDLLQQFISHTAIVNTVNFAPDGQTALSGGDDGTIFEWGLVPGNVVRQIENPSGINDVAIHPNGKTALTALSDDSVVHWDLQTGEQLAIWEGHGLPVNTVVFSLDGSRAASGSCGGRDMFGSCNAGEIIVWDVASGDIVQTFEGHSDLVTSVAFSPDGEWLLTASNDRTMLLWNVELGTVDRVFTGHELAIKSVEFSPDGERAISASEDQTLILWDVATGDIIRAFEGHTESVNHATFNAEGDLILSASTDETVRLWETETGRLVRLLTGHSGIVNTVAFGPTDEFAISGAADQTLILWNVGQGEPLYTFTAHSRAVTGVAFDPNGHYAISGAADRLLIYWRIDTLPQLIDWVKENRFARSLTCAEREQLAIDPQCDDEGNVPVATDTP